MSHPLPPAVSVREVRGAERDALVPLLLLAEPSPRALEWSLANLSDAAYRMDAGTELVGAATVRWTGEPSEIVELAVREDRQGQGLGRALVRWLLDEARRRGKRAMIVGTANASLGNIAFYQKCGFRMDHVRPDYFWYVDQPASEHEIPVRDMLVFRYDLSGSAPPRRGRR